MVDLTIRDDEDHARVLSQCSKISQRTETFNFVTTIIMKVLSLFDGISCGRIALERAGIKVDKYFASEIDKYAIQVSKKNWPDIVHIGDIRDIKFSAIRDIF